MEDGLVLVTRQPGDHRVATYRIEDVHDVRWGHMTGGVSRSLTWPTLFGYVNCTAMVEGDVAHSGVHGPCPHSIKVVILRKQRAYKTLAAKAGPKPPGPQYGRPHMVRDAPKIYRVWCWSYRQRRREWAGPFGYKDALAQMKAWRSESEY